MKNDNKNPGSFKNTPLDTRMKIYEAVSERSLVPGIPVYIRLDGRAFHTFCHGLEKPFDPDFTQVMQNVTKYIHRHTNATLSFCQSDEMSFVYESPEKMPFECRVNKILSTMAGMASSAFCIYGMEDSRSEKFRTRIKNMIPHFDARVCQMSIDECANMILWRSQDSVKNSITLLALAHFSHKELQNKHSDDKIRMLREKGIDYFELDEGLRFGCFFRRENYMKVLTEDELASIPERNRPADGKAMRSVISRFALGYPLQYIRNRIDFLFHGAGPEYDLEKINERMNS